VCWRGFYLLKNEHDKAAQVSERILKNDPGKNEPAV